MRRRKRAPDWASTGTLKVLVENEDPAMVWADERVLRRAGYGTRFCAGPAGPRASFPYGRCLLVEDGRCPLVEGADVVVFGLGLGQPYARAVLHALRTRLPDIPVCIDAPGPEVSNHPNLVAGCTAVPFPDAGSGLLAAVRGALGGRARHESEGRRCPNRA